MEQPTLINDGYKIGCLTGEVFVYS